MAAMSSFLVVAIRYFVQNTYEKYLVKFNREAFNLISQKYRYGCRRRRALALCPVKFSSSCSRRKLRVRGGEKKPNNENHLNGITFYSADTQRESSDEHLHGRFLHTIKYLYLIIT